MNIFIVLLSGLLYRLGGWKSFKWCKHNKLIRRIGIPVLVYLIMFSNGIVLKECILTSLLAWLALTMPLGDDETLQQNILSALCLSLYSAYSLGLSWLNVVPFMVYFFSLWASKRFIDWWICEVLIGMAFILQVL